MINKLVLEVLSTRLKFQRLKDQLMTVVNHRRDKFQNVGGRTGGEYTLNIVWK